MKKRNILFVIGIVVVIVIVLVLVIMFKKKNSNLDDKSIIENKKSLVVYFSATNNTERVANVIARSINADIFALEAVVPYTSSDLNWSNQNSRVYKEYRDESLRKVELINTKVPDWDSYEVVFIGYPIWWGMAAWPVNSFIESNDFNNKIVIPFCTSASSDILESENALKEMANGGNWVDGYRFSSSATSEEVNTWLNSLS